MTPREILTEKLGKSIDRSKVNLCNRIVCQHKYGLNLEQQEFLEARKNSKKSHLLDFTQEVFKNPALIEQSEEYKNVRKFMELTWRNSSYDLEWEYTDEKLDFIFANGDKMSAKEIALSIFPDKEPTSCLRTISNLLDAAGIKQGEEEDVAAETSVYSRYNPPKTDLQVVNLINKSDPFAKYDYNNLDIRKKESVAAVKKFLSSPRFIQHVSEIESKERREVLESEFVKAVYNKSDLNSDQVNLYINLSLDYVNLLEITKQIHSWKKMLEDIPTGGGEEGVKMTHSVSEALKDRTAALNQCLARIQTATKSLSGDRVKQLEKQAAANQSLHQFVELVKDENERKRMMLIARSHEFNVKEKIEELSSFDELFVQVFGLGKEEVFSM